MRLLTNIQASYLKLVVCRLLEGQIIQRIGEKWKFALNWSIWIYKLDNLKWKYFITCLAKCKDNSVICKTTIVVNTVPISYDGRSGQQLFNFWFSYFFYRFFDLLASKAWVKKVTSYKWDLDSNRYLLHHSPSQSGGVLPLWRGHSFRSRLVSLSHGAQLFFSY